LRENDEVSRIHVYRGRALKMKHTALMLLLGLALLPLAVLADQAPVSVCVNALEQLEALETVAPVQAYKKPGASIFS
jgi:uncharacterized membrane protein (Fun14 family)